MSETPRTDEHLRMKEENGHAVIVSRDFARQLETELADKDKQLAKARARIDHLECIIDEMTEEQTALCAEGQSITELVAAKDKLIEQLKLALKTLRKYPHTYKMTGRSSIVVDKDIEQCNAALLAAERGE